MEFEQCLFNEDFKKSRQRGKERERTETMTGLTLSECPGFLMASLVFGFCCFCTWNASSTCAESPTLGRLLLIKSVAKQCSTNHKSRRANPHALYTLKVAIRFISSQMYSWEHFKELDSYHSVSYTFFMHSNYSPWSNS